MFLLKNLQTPAVLHPDLERAICQKLSISANQIETYDVQLRSLDARHKDRLRFNYTLLVQLSGNTPLHPDLIPFQPPLEKDLPLHQITDPHPFIIGAGPAGLFCALAMVEKGLKPIIFDRGEAVDNRGKTVKEFWKSGKLDPASNVQFGEGGAGTFSDGKLTSRNRSTGSEAVFNWLIRFGAASSIRWEALPHLGTDGLKKVILALHQYLEDHGCQFYWNSPLTDIVLQDGRIMQVTIAEQIYKPETVVIALGNAARDTFTMLGKRGIAIESKSFAVGFRIEHPQSFLNERFYGKKANISVVGPATYRLTTTIGKRGVYSFCMCPGGKVIAAASELQGQVVNGMSYASRDGEFGNSAIVVTVDALDFGKHPFSGMEQQKTWESKAWRQRFAAPAQNAYDYVHNSLKPLVRKTSYEPEVHLSGLNSLYTKEVNQALQQGLIMFDKKINGFLKEGILLGVETRTSSPIRIVRDVETLHSVSSQNLYPIGEGAGYAGGIISSAVDGYRLGSLFRFL